MRPTPAPRASSPTPSTASFPRSPSDLRSTTQCPACFTPLQAIRCQRCGLDLSHPSAGELAALSATIADDLDARLALIARMRSEGAGAPAPAPAAVSAPSATTPAPAAREADGRPRRSGVQVALIVVGISLLSVFALFAVVYAFITYGTTVRTLLIGGATLATMAAASLLSRRGLGVTGEGLAALGTVVLVLDAWALRRTDAAGLAAIPEAGYWGSALLAIAILGAVWSRLGGHRTPLVASTVLAPLGAGLLAAELASDLPLGADAAIGALAASVTAALVVALTPRTRPTTQSRGLRALLAIAPLVAIPISVVPLLVGIDELTATGWFAPTLAGVLYAAVAGLAAVLVLRPSGELGRAAASVAGVLSVTGALTLVGSLMTAAESTGNGEATLALSVLAPSVLAVCADVAQYRRRGDGARVPLAATAIAAGLLAALAALGAGGVALERLFSAATRGLDAHISDVRVDVMQSGTIELVGVGTLGAALVAIVVTWRIGRMPVTVGRAVPLGSVAGLTAVLALALAPTWVVAIAAAGALAIGSAAALALRARWRAPDVIARALRIALTITAPASGAIAVTMGWALEGAWWVGTLIALAALALGRIATRDTTARAVAVAVASLLVISVAPPLAAALTVDGTALTIAVAGLVLVLGRSPGTSAAERLAVVLATVPLGLLLAVLDADGAASHAVVDVLALGVLLVALAVIAVDRRSGPDRPIALVALALVAALFSARALVMALALLDASALFPVPVAERSLAALGALAVLAALGATAATITDRRWMDAGIAVVAALALGGTLGASREPLALLVAGVIALATAVSRDGLFGSASPRRLLGWVALALSTAALWRLLADEGLRDPELFVLPLGAALLVIAGLLARRGQDGDVTAVSGPTVIAGGALLVMGLPLAALAGDGSALRGAAVGVVATLLALGALLGRVRDTARWTGAGVTVLTASVVVQVVLAASVTERALRDLPALAHPLVQLSAALIVIMLIGTAVAAWWLAPRTDGRVTSRPHAVVAVATSGAAALAALVVGIAGAVDPVELVAVPLALGLLLIGTLELDQRPEARSTPWLGPGTIALLVPSLVAVSITSDLWRVVALGLVATGALVLGAVRRLQGPFLLGAIVLLIHLGIQTWPLLERIGEAVEWWIWLGVAGIAVVALAARYEQRLRDLKTTVQRISELR